MVRSRTDPAVTGDAEGTARRPPAVTTLLAAGFLAFALVHLAWPALKSTPTYHEPIAGMATWDGSDKARDTRALVLFLASAGALAIGLDVFLKALVRRTRGKDVPEVVGGIVALALAPALFWLGHNVAFPDRYLRPTEPALILAATLGLLGGLWRFRRQLVGKAVVEIVAASLLLAFFGLLDGAAVAVSLDRSFPTWLAPRPWLGRLLLGLGAAGGLVAVLRAYVVAGSLHEVWHRLARPLMLAQAPLPLLYFAVLTPRLVVGGHALPAAYRWGLYLVLAAPVAVAALEWRRVGRETAWGAVPVRGLLGLLAPWCLGAVAVFLATTTQGLPWIAPDPFHSGEQILPWHQWSRFGKVPYVDFVPIHGLMPLIRGAANDYLFRGTAATFGHVDALLLGASVLATFLALWRFAGPGVALFVLLIPGVTSPLLFDRCYFLVPALLVLCRPGWLSRPVGWLWAWGLLSVFMVGYNFAFGLAFVLGTAPAFLWMARLAVLGERRRLIQSAWVAAGLLVLVVLTPPARAVGVGFLQYLRENSATNDILHCIPWTTSLNGTIATKATDIRAHRFLLESMRMSWVAAVLVLGYAVWRELVAPARQRRPYVLLLALNGIGALLFLASWTNGRIDPGHWSRPGAVSFLALGTLLPAVLLAGRPIARLGGVAGALAVVAGLLSPADVRTLPERGYAQAVAAHIQPKEFALTDGRDLGMPNLGRGLMGPPMLEEFRELKAAMGRYLPPGKTYLDLTNRSAYYHDLDLPVPGLYVANFVAGNRRTQARMLDQWRDDPPPVTLIAPADNFDGPPASIRSYYLYRDALLRSVAVREGRFHLLVDPALAPEAGPIGSDEQLDRLDDVYWFPNLRRLPATWGQSWPAMAGLFREVAAIPVDRPASLIGLESDAGGDFRTTAAEARVVLPFPGGPLDGVDADFLRLDLAPRRGGRAKARLQVRWRVGERTVDGPFLEVDKGPLLVPLGAYPRWLLAKRIDAVELVVLSGGPGFSFGLSDVKLLRLSPPE